MKKMTKKSAADSDMTPASKNPFAGKSPKGKAPKKAAPKTPKGK